MKSLQLDQHRWSFGRPYKGFSKLLYFILMIQQTFIKKTIAIVSEHVFFKSGHEMKKLNGVMLLELYVIQLSITH
jgi:hypothetical protein